MTDREIKICNNGEPREEDQVESAYNAAIIIFAMFASLNLSLIAIIILSLLFK